MQSTIFFEYFRILKTMFNSFNSIKLQNQIKASFKTYLNKVLFNFCLPFADCMSFSDLYLLAIKTLRNH